MKDEKLIPSNVEIMKWNEEWATINKNKITNLEYLLSEHDKFLCRKAANWAKEKLQYREVNPFITGGRDID